DVALSADVAQFTSVAAAEFTRCHAQPSAELAAISKTLGLAYCGFQGAGGQQTNTADLIEFTYHFIVGMPALELLFALDHALFVQVDFRQDDMQLMTQGRDLWAIN